MINCLSALRFNGKLCTKVMDLSSIRAGPYTLTCTVTLTGPGKGKSLRRYPLQKNKRRNDWTHSKNSSPLVYGLLSACQPRMGGRERSRRGAASERNDTGGNCQGAGLHD